MDPSPETNSLSEELQPDPIFVTGLREAKWILFMWLCCFIWTMSYCINNGYQTEVDPANFPTVFGIPEWVAWGIGLPWIIANVVTIAFCFGYMQDGDLEDPEFNSNAASKSGANDV